MLFAKFNTYLQHILIKGFTDKQLVCSFLLGGFISFVPNNIVVDIFSFIIILLFRFNIFVSSIGALIFFLCQLLLLPVMHFIGVLVLIKIPLLTFLIKLLYHIPFVAYFNLNYTVICGAYVLYGLSFYFLLKISFYFVQDFKKFVRGEKIFSFSLMNDFKNKFGKKL